MNIKDLNTGSGSGFHAAMLAFALILFGPNPKKKDKTSWEPTADDYANKLLDCFVGTTTWQYGNVACRLFLRAVLARELGTYLLTGNKTPGLYLRVKELDKMYWCGGYPGSLQTKALPAHN